jgi:hypothetical protein
MRVSELIELLKEVDADKQVYAYYDGEIAELLGVDELDDRVDLNLLEE